MCHYIVSVAIARINGSSPANASLDCGFNFCGVSISATVPTSGAIASAGTSKLVGSIDCGVSFCVPNI